MIGQNNIFLFNDRVKLLYIVSASQLNLFNTYEKLVYKRRGSIIYKLMNIITDLLRKPGNLAGLFLYQ